MKSQKKFITTVLGAIAVYLIAITATADVTKGIGLQDNKIQPEKEITKISKEEEKEIAKSSIDKTATEENNISTPDTKDENSVKAVSPEPVNTEAPKTEIETKEDEPVKEEIAQEVSNNINYGFTNKLKTSLFSDNKGTKVLDTLRKATRVEILEEKQIETKKESKIKKKDGTFEIKVTAQTTNWTKVKYNKNLKIYIGWVRSENISKDIHKVSPENLKNISFKPVEKINYPDNPKRNNVRGVYLTVYSAASEKKMNEMIALAKRTPINAFVIDVKDDGGKLLFKTEAEKKYLGVSFDKYPVNDIQKFIQKLKDNNIYVIARIVSFKDPRYAKKNPDKAIIKLADGKPYTNSDGVIWVSAHDRNLWEYNVAVAKEAAKAGFNEIQFDYVRFPASNGGKLDKQLNYRNTNGESKPETIAKYLKYARKELSPLGVYIAADVYGQVGSSSDDMGLGQHWEVIANEVDFICPMAYPSHYGKGVYGLSVPDANPYTTIYRSTLDGVNRNNNIDYPANVRPWLQAFTAKWVKGHINYGKNEIDAQVKALKDLGIDEYLLWSPSNKYGIVEK